MGLIEQFANGIKPLLTFPIIRDVRRNHGLEHGTIRLLNQHRFQLSGVSFNRGFIIFGEVPTNMVEEAAHDALARMKRGERYLAIHPNCGTNLVTTGFLTTLIAAITFSGTSKRTIWDRFSLVMLLMMITVLVSQPIGMSIQKHITTDSNLGDMEIIRVSRKKIKLPFNDMPMLFHYVLTG